MSKLVEMYVRMLAAVQEPRKGQGLVEYVLILALISVVAIAIMMTVGEQVISVFSQVADALGA